MAKVVKAFSAKFQTTRDGDIEETHFAVGDEVTLMKAWDAFDLVRDQEGHCFNIRKGHVAG